MIKKVICLITGHKYDNVYGSRLSKDGNIYLEVGNCCRCGKVFEEEVVIRDRSYSFLGVMRLAMIIIFSIFVIWFYLHGCY